MQRESLSLAVKLNVIGEYQLHICKALDLVGLRIIYFEGGETNSTNMEQLQPY